MLYDELRKHITEQIKAATSWPVFYNRADENQPYPYISFDLMEHDTTDDYRHNYTMQVDFWDVDTPKDVIKAKSKIDIAFKRYLSNEETFVVTIRQGSLGEMVEDEDRRIRHYARGYEVAAYSKEGE